MITSIEFQDHGNAIVRARSIFGRDGSMEFSPDVANRIMDWTYSNPAIRPFVQDAFSDLSDDEREFLITGMTPDEWTDQLGEEED